MSMNEACCTCATLLNDTKVPYDPESEKPLVLDRRLDCCSRTICATCQYKNPRFQNYCPFCQISSTPTALPQTGLRLPPSYTKTGPGETSLRTALQDSDAPPPYDSLPQRPSTSSRSTEPPQDTPDTIHHLSPNDTLSSLSLAYSVPITILRQHNSFPPSGGADYLIAARKHLLIPASHYTGPSLSTPPDPEEEEKKNKLRRWMVATKCVDYSVAGLYLKGAEWDVEGAVERYRGDEEWERRNPMKGKEKIDKKGWSGGGSLVGQLR